MHRISGLLYGKRAQNLPPTHSKEIKTQRLGRLESTHRCIQFIYAHWITASASAAAPATATAAAAYTLSPSTPHCLYFSDWLLGLMAIAQSTDTCTLRLVRTSRQFRSLRETRNSRITRLRRKRTRLAGFGCGAVLWVRVACRFLPGLWGRRSRAQGSWRRRRR